jgi:hypothetical protein
MKTRLFFKLLSLGLIICGVLIGQLISFRGLWLEGGFSNRTIEHIFNDDWNRAAELSQESGIPFYFDADHDDPGMWAYQGKSISSVDFANVHGIPFIYGYRHIMLDHYNPFGKLSSSRSSTTWIFDGAEILEIRRISLAANLLIGVAIIWASSLMIMTTKYSKLRPIRFSLISAAASVGCFVLVWRNLEFHATSSWWWEYFYYNPFKLFSVYQFHIASIFVLWAARFATLVGSYFLMMVAIHWTSAKYNKRKEKEIHRVLARWVESGKRCKVGQRVCERNPPSASVRAVGLRYANPT